GKYYCRIRLTPAEGYYFPTEKTTINYRPAYLYTGKVSVNGEPYNANVYCNADGTSMVIDWWEEAAQPALRQSEITVAYENENVSVTKDANLVLTAFHDTHPEAKNLKFQWYEAYAPEQWGTAVEGAADCAFVVPTDAVGVKYYRCHITAELDGKTISTPMDKFLCVKVTVEAPPAPIKTMSFSDVKNSDWFYEDVQYVYDRGLMDGVGNNKFDPNGKCTRAMIVTILYRMEGKPSHSGKNPFTDVKAEQWYTDAVIWAAENNIVNGVGNGKFDPNANITREQLATILCRYAAYHGDYNEEDGVMLVTFADQDKISDWAGDAMSWAVGVGLIGGSGEKDGLYLLPGGNALRCQVAAIFHRFCVSFKES
ncbi:MAG: S-layer homology domain-containing protein, partial [Faecousia sp.]